MSKVFRRLIAATIAIIVIVVGIFATRIIYERRQLNAGSTDIKAVIDNVGTIHHEESMQRVGRHRYRKMPAYTETVIHYTYSVDGKEYHDDVSTRKGMIHTITKGDSIPVTYAISNPGINRAHPELITKHGRRTFVR